VNSYAFYYSRTDKWSKIYFRLGYGGIYMDNKEEAKNINRFFQNYFPFEKRIKKDGFKLLAIDSMEEALYQNYRGVEERRCISFDRR